MDTHLYNLCVRSEAVKKEADDSQVPTVKHQLLWCELQRGIWGHQLGPVWAHCNTGVERQMRQRNLEYVGFNSIYRKDKNMCILLDMLFKYLI